MEEIGGNQEEILSIQKFGGYKTKVKERITGGRDRLALRNKMKRRNTCRDIKRFE